MPLLMSQLGHFATELILSELIALGLLRRVCCHWHQGCLLVTVSYKYNSKESQLKTWTLVSSKCQGRLEPQKNYMWWLQNLQFSWALLTFFLILLVLRNLPYPIDSENETENNEQIYSAARRLSFVIALYKSGPRKFVTWFGYISKGQDGGDSRLRRKLFVYLLLNDWWCIRLSRGIRFEYQRNISCIIHRPVDKIKSQKWPQI